jgi:hypothetical protein
MRSSEMLANFYHITLGYVPEDNIFHESLCGRTVKHSGGKHLNIFKQPLIFLTALGLWTASTSV